MICHFHVHTAITTYINILAGNISFHQKSKESREMIIKDSYSHHVLAHLNRENKYKVYDHTLLF